MCHSFIRHIWFANWAVNWRSKQTVCVGFDESFWHIHTWRTTNTYHASCGPSLKVMRTSLFGPLIHWECWYQKTGFLTNRWSWMYFYKILLYFFHFFLNFCRFYLTYFIFVMLAMKKVLVSILQILQQGNLKVWMRRYHWLNFSKCFIKIL